MAEKTYILCPGQGAQSLGMGQELVEKSAAAREVFATADRVLGFDLSGICFGGPEDRLNQTDVSQPALYVTGIACFRAALEAGAIDPAAVTAYAGLSLGEYTALHLAGSLGYEDGLKLVQSRGRFMQEAAVATPSGMIAILGASEEQVRNLCESSGGGEVLVPANFNAPGQIVISGAAGACRRALEAADGAGFKATQLKVAGAFHSPLMQPAADRMAAELEKVSFAVPQRPVYSNVTALAHGDEISIRRRLVEQIISPVRWQQTMQHLIAGGEARYLELAPGRTLAGLAKRIDRRLPVQSVTI